MILTKRQEEKIKTDLRANVGWLKEGEPEVLTEGAISTIMAIIRVNLLTRDDLETISKQEKLQIRQNQLHQHSLFFTANGNIRCRICKKFYNLS